jgi:enoyl-CoA hydratase
VSELVDTERAVDGVAHIILNRPEKLNALSLALVSKLVASLRAANDDSSVGCVVLSGRGRAFSAGADIADQHAHGEKVVFNPGRLSDWHDIESFPKPLVAAATGYVLGGGNELAMLADVIIAGESARFGQPEIKIGIFPGDGGTQRLVRAVGKSLAMQMILTGEPIDAATALRAGLVSEVVSDAKAVERALEVGRLIARHSPVATCAAKRSVLRAFQLSLDEGLESERAIFAEVYASDDRREGMAAFLERRPAQFSGRVRGDVMGGHRR